MINKDPMRRYMEICSFIVFFPLSLLALLVRLSNLFIIMTNCGAKNKIVRTDKNEASKNSTQLLYILCWLYWRHWRIASLNPSHKEISDWFWAHSKNCLISQAQGASCCCCCCWPPPTGVFWGASAAAAELPPPVKACPTTCPCK